MIESFPMPMRKSRIGGALGLICSIWVIPRFETLESFLFIVFCVHGLAAWIAVGHDRISYIGLQIALAFERAREYRRDDAVPIQVHPTHS